MRGSESMSESLSHKSGESQASYEFATDDTCGLMLKTADKILDDSDQELDQFQQINLKLDQPNFAYLEGETDVQLIIIRWSETSQAQAVLADWPPKTSPKATLKSSALAIST